MSFRATSCLYGNALKPFELVDAFSCSSLVDLSAVKNFVNT